MVTKPKHASETQAVVQALNDKIAQLKQMRDLLADPEILALTKQLVQNHTTRAAGGLHSRAARSTTYRGRVHSAYEAIQRFSSELFTKHDVAESLRQAGHECENPKNQLRHAMERFVADGVIAQIQPRIGPRPAMYQRTEYAQRASEVKSLGKGEEPTGNGTSVSATAIEKELRLRDPTLRIAFLCIESLDEPFCSQELIRKMRAAGHTFVGDPNVSIRSVLQKLLNRGILEVVEDGAGQRPTTYKRMESISEWVDRRF